MLATFIRITPTTSSIFNPITICAATAPHARYRGATGACGNGPGGRTTNARPTQSSRIRQRLAHGGLALPQAPHHSSKRASGASWLPPWPRHSHAGVVTRYGAQTDIPPLSAVSSYGRVLSLSAANHAHRILSNVDGPAPAAGPHACPPKTSPYWLHHRVGYHAQTACACHLKGGHSRSTAGLANRTRPATGCSIAARIRPFAQQRGLRVSSVEPRQATPLTRIIYEV